MSTATFAEQGHIYEVDGVAIPSVTQVLTLAGISDVSGIPAHILERASAIGTATHKATELLDQDDLDISSLDPLIIGFVAAYQRFREDYKFVPTFIEHRGVGFCDGMQFGYCIDRLGHCEDASGETYAVLLDLKTSSRPQASWRIQTAAYQDGVRAEFIGERQIVHLAKDGSYRRLIHDEPADLEVWRSALRVAHWKLANGAKLK